LAMFENFFQMLSDETKCSVMRLVYERNLPKNGNLVFLGNYLKSFSSEVARCVNGIGDHNEIQNNPQKFSDIRKKLSWYLFTVPGPTLRSLLSQALFEFTVKSEKVPLEDIPILIDSIIFLFEEEASSARMTLKSTVIMTDESVLEGGVLVRLFVLPNLMKRTHEVAMLKLLLRLIQSSGVKSVSFEWTTAIGEKSLYKSLSLDRQEQYEQISVDFPFSPAECFFRSLFELAFFEIDVALDFLKKGIAVFPRDENLIEKIAIALVDSCEQTSYKRNITSLAPLLSELLWESDNGRNLRSYPACESDSGMTHAADTLLQAFCELTKVHAEKEVVNLRHSRLFQPPDIKEDQLPPPHVNVRLDERTYAQIAVLFNVSCSLTRLIPKSNTVYAFAKADVKKQGNYKKEENQEKC
uniref:Integrator complex subunit 7 n=1 Tax=Angiostrongylus cantonensis TaxID=6313 RepID=A0A0K0CUV6_ANGCA